MHAGITLVTLVFANASLGCILDWDQEWQNDMGDGGKINDSRAGDLYNGETSLIVDLTHLDYLGFDAIVDLNISDTKTKPDAVIAKQTCNKTYGHIPKYILCKQNADSCIFYYRATKKASCDEMCMLGKGKCLKVQGNINETCKTQGLFLCNVKYTDGICWCTR